MNTQIRQGGLASEDAPRLNRTRVTVKRSKRSFRPGRNLSRQVFACSGACVYPAASPPKTQYNPTAGPQWFRAPSSCFPICPLASCLPCPAHLDAKTDSASPSTGKTFLKLFQFFDFHKVIFFAARGELSEAGDSTQSAVYCAEYVNPNE